MKPDASVRRGSARDLMRQAQDLLGDADAVAASTYLEYAIACLDLADASAGPEDAEEKAAIPLLVAPRDPVLARAMGGTLTILGTVLERNGVIELRELASLLGIFATVTAEDDPACGTVIAGWGGMMVEAASDFAAEHG